jgi:hypothetical protein
MANLPEHTSPVNPSSSCHPSQTTIDEHNIKGEQNSFFANFGYRDTGYCLKILIDGIWRIINILLPAQAGSAKPFLNIQGVPMPTAGIDSSGNDPIIPVCEIYVNAYKLPFEWQLANSAPNSQFVHAISIPRDLLGQGGNKPKIIYKMIIKHIEYIVHCIEIWKGDDNLLLIPAIVTEKSESLERKVRQRSHTFFFGRLKYEARCPVTIEGNEKCVHMPLFLAARRRHPLYAYLSALELFSKGYSLRQVAEKVKGQHGLAKFSYSTVRRLAIMMGLVADPAGEKADGEETGEPEASAGEKADGEETGEPEASAGEKADGEETGEPEAPAGEKADGEETGEPEAPAGRGMQNLRRIAGRLLRRLLPDKWKSNPWDSLKSFLKGWADSFGRPFPAAGRQGG